MARNAGVSHPPIPHIPVSEPQGHSHHLPPGASVEAAPACVAFTMTAEHTSATTFRDFENQGLTHNANEGTWRAPGPHRGWEEGEPGALPSLESQGGVARVSRVHSLLANLKQKSGN